MVIVVTLLIWAEKCNLNVNFGEQSNFHTDFAPKYHLTTKFSCKIIKSRFDAKKWKNH